MPRRIFMTVADVSGDQHAAALVRRLRAMDPDIVVEGLGGSAMREAGAIIHHDTVTGSAMGLRAALRAMEFRRLLKWTDQHYAQNRINLHICVDSSGINFHFAKLARQHGTKVLYYIAPQVWASREGRLKTMRQCIDRIACIWQFEEEYFRRNGLDATYVGHPLFDELPPTDQRLIPPADKFPQRPPIVGLLPGSRRSDATSNLPHLLDVAERIYRAVPDVTFSIPTTAATDAVVRQRVARAGEAAVPSPPAKRVRIELDGFDRLVPHCDLCITKSGTSTLHVAAYGVPMIVVYRVNPVLWHGLGRWIVKTRTFSIVNMLADAHEHIVPEHVPWYGSNQPVADQAIDYLRRPDRLLEQRSCLLQLIRNIDQPGASENVARLVLEMTGGERDEARHRPAEADPAQEAS